MRKLLISFLIGISILGVSCGKSEVKQDTKEETQTEAKEETKEETPVKKEMTATELELELSKQPMTVINTEYLVQSNDYKTLYPDMLSAVIQNNSGTDIKNAVVGLVAWDSNNFPVKIKGSTDFSDGAYFQMVDYGDVNMVNGTTFGKQKGMTIDENCNIAKFKAIVVSYTDFDGNKWTNPYIKDFRRIYEDKKLIE